MPASIFGERFLGRREPAWHGLGTVVPADARMSPAEAVVRSGCDYWVQKYPLTVKLPDGTVRDADRVAIVRHPVADDGSYHILGYAGRDYEVVQNIELGFMLEDLGVDWPVETVGALGEGETAFITLDAGSASVQGDEVRQYFLLANSHTGGRSLRIALTPVRVVCQNTLMAGLSAASVVSSLPHTSQVRVEADFRIKLISGMRKQQERLLADFDAMARRRVTDDEAAGIISAAYPMPKPPKKKLLGDVVVNSPALQVPDDKQFAIAALSTFRAATEQHEQAVKRVEVLRAGATERYGVFNEEFDQVAATAWAAWQAVTETENYRNGGKDDRATAESVLFGERAQAMARSFEAALALCR